MTKSNLSLLCTLWLAAGCSTQRAPDAPLASNEPVVTSSNVHSHRASSQGSSAANTTGTSETWRNTTGTTAATTDSTPLRNADNTTASQNAGDRYVNGTGSQVLPAPASASPNSVAPATPIGGGPTTAPDNTRVNTRDRDDRQLTPMDQGGSESDRTTTQKIRQAVVGDKALSFNAKNVKIITVNGRVTLRGPVKSDAERASIEAKAREVAGTQVDNQLEVKP
jgi:hypothetical protein